jgi:hypothetical protein
MEEYFQSNQPVKFQTKFHFSKTTGTRNPIIESSDFPVSGEIPGGVGVFTRQDLAQDFPPYVNVLISLRFFDIGGMAYSLLSIQ